MFSDTYLHWDSVSAIRIAFFIVTWLFAFLLFVAPLIFFHYALLFEIVHNAFVITKKSNISTVVVPETLRETVEKPATATEQVDEVFAEQSKNMKPSEEVQII
jgi:hypothetical protein